MTDREALVAGIREHPNDSTPIRIFADWCEEHGSPGLAKLLRIGVTGPLLKGGGHGGGYGGGYGDGGDGGDGGGHGGHGGYGDGGHGGYGGGHGGHGGYGDGGHGGYGDGGGHGGYGYGGGHGGYKKRLVSEALDMRNGLHILTVSSGYAPYVIVGWARLGDLFVESSNCRVVRWFGSQAQLAVIARKGPQADTQLLEPSEYESIGVACIGRVIPCNEKAWAKHCPKPNGWAE